MVLRSVEDLKLYKKTVMVRVDFNIPVAPDGTIAQRDEFRLTLPFPTIAYLLKRRCSILLVAHRGRPKGRDEHMSLYPVYERVRELLLTSSFANRIDHISFLPDILKYTRGGIAERQIALAENLRFIRGETLNDTKLARHFAARADAFVNDAFSVCHNDHASVSGVTRFVPSAAGYALMREVDQLGSILKRPRRPFLVVFGGSKADTKFKLVEKFLVRADYMFVSGIAGNTFLSAAGHTVGGSAVERSIFSAARALVEKPRKHFLENQLPVPESFVVDFDRYRGRAMKRLARRILVQNDGRIGTMHGTAARDISFLDNGVRVAPSDAILDIGERTQRFLERAVRRARQILWNGPLGYFENPAFEAGTKAFVTALESQRRRVILGGGETVSAYRKYGGTERRNVFISSGGGAMLEFLINPELPGLVPLRKRG